MRYSFKDILNEDLYMDTRVMFVFGKYPWFNNMVVDTLKSTVLEENTTDDFINNTDTINLDDEFGIESTQEDDSINSVDLNTFMEVNRVSSINGKWYCRTSVESLTKKQKDFVAKYIKDPSENGLLIITSDDWFKYKELMKWKALSVSKYSHLVELSWPRKQELKAIVAQTFEENGIAIDSDAIDLFILKMSSAYDKYEEYLNYIIGEHNKAVPLTSKEMKEYMHGVENFIIHDYIEQLMIPVSSDKTNNKKVLRMMAALEDEFTAKGLVHKLIKEIDKYIEYRILINNGYIPIGINYFFKDTINSLPDKYKEKYKDINEWKFRREAQLASCTSLRDWQYMRMMLYKAISNVMLPENVMEEKCKRALYDISLRSVMNPSRVNNILGLENVLGLSMSNLNKIKYNEESLDKIAEVESKLTEEDYNELYNSYIDSQKLLSEQPEEKEKPKKKRTKKEKKEETFKLSDLLNEDEDEPIDFESILSMDEEENTEENDSDSMVDIEANLLNLQKRLGYI